MIEFNSFLYWLWFVSEATSEENQLLGCFRYARNKAYLHNDESLMPIRRNAWSSWNYLRRPVPEPGPTNVPATTTDLVLTYWMNRLQPFLSRKFPLFVTLNPPIPPPANKTFATFDYEHPIYLAQGIRSQDALQKYQGTNATFFCGAYCGFGFHEDGLVSGIKVAESLGAKCPWQLNTKPYDVPSNPTIPYRWIPFVRPFIVLLLLSLLLQVLYGLYI